MKLLRGLGALFTLHSPRRTPTRAEINAVVSPRGGKASKEKHAERKRAKAARRRNR